MYILERKDLRGANLQGFDFSGAILIKADISEAIPCRANFSRADFYRADLSETDLSGADLKKAKNLTIEQLSKVKTLYNAKLDEELRKQLEEAFPERYQKLIKIPERKIQS